MGSILSVESYFRSIKRTEMYAELYQYLLHYKNLPVPGIGTFLLERSPATSDFANRVFHPPAYRIVHTSVVEHFSKHFYSRLGNILGTSDRESVDRFLEFTNQASRELQSGNRIRWSGVGLLSRALNGDIHFEPEQLVTEDPIEASKVLREKVTHTVRVGEEERSSEEMTRMLRVTETKRSNNWLWPVLLILVSVLFIGWHLSVHGVDTGSTGNGRHIVPHSNPETYRLLGP
jgi:hypothetical protein